MTLRARVAAAAAAAIVLAVALLVIAVPKLLAGDLRGELDDTLQRRAADVARLNATAPSELTAPGALGAGAASRSSTARGGSSPAPARSAAACCPWTPTSSATARRDSPTTGSAPTAVRVYTAPLGELGAGAAAGGVVVVASDLAGIEHTLDRTRSLIALCALVAAALAAALATVLTRRALRPLSRLSAGARAIGRAGDASRRLPGAGGPRRGG